MLGVFTSCISELEGTHMQNRAEQLVWDNLSDHFTSPLLLQHNLIIRERDGEIARGEQEIRFLSRSVP